MHSEHYLLPDGVMFSSLPVGDGALPLCSALLSSAGCSGPVRNNKSCFGDIHAYHNHFWFTTACKIVNYLPVLAVGSVLSLCNVLPLKGAEFIPKVFYYSVLVWPEKQAIRYMHFSETREQLISHSILKCVIIPVMYT